LMLGGSEARKLVVGHQIEPRPEEGEDVRGLRDQEATGPQDRRREGTDLAPRRIQHPLDRLEAASLALRQASHVDVVGGSLFERETNELAATLDARPVVELVLHGFPLPLRWSRMFTGLSGITSKPACAKWMSKLNARRTSSALM